MHLFLLEALSFSLLIQLISASSDIPTLDLRDGITQNSIPVLKVSGEHQLFRILVTANPSTGFQWFDIRNPRSNCLSLVQLRGKSYQRRPGPRLMGQSVTEALTYETKVQGKQQILLVYSRAKPSLNSYDELNQIGKDTYPIIIDIGANEAENPCQA